MIMNLTVIGAPGTGKTAFIERLIKERSTNDFLYLTYNKSMAIAAEQRIGSEGRVSTFHSAMSRLNGLNSFLSHTDKVEFAKQMGFTFPQKNIDVEGGKTDLERFLAWYDLTIHTMSSPEQPKDERLNMRYAMKAYENYKKEVEKLDYTDVIRIGAEHIYHIGDLYVDEAQDLTPLMWKIVDNFKTDNLTIAGDPHQSIYSYKGVSVKEFQQHMENVKILDKSHRYGDNLRALSELALGRGRVMTVPYVGTGKTEIDMHTLADMAYLPGTKAILTRTNALARHLAETVPYAIKNIKKDNKYSNGWNDTTFELGRIMKKWPHLSPSESAYIARPNITGADLWVRGTQAKAKRHELTLDAYSLLRQKMAAADLINHMTIDEKMKKNVLRLLKEDVPILYCDTIHSAKGLEFDHVMLITDIPQFIENDFSTEEFRILYVGLTRARKSINFQNIGFYKGNYEIPGHAKVLNTPFSLVSL